MRGPSTGTLPLGDPRTRNRRSVTGGRDPGGVGLRPTRRRPPAPRTPLAAGVQGRLGPVRWPARSPAGKWFGLAPPRGKPGGPRGLRAGRTGAGGPVVGGGIRSWRRSRPAARMDRAPDPLPTRGASRWTRTTFHRPGWQHTGGGEKSRQSRTRFCGFFCLSVPSAAAKAQPDLAAETVKAREVAGLGGAESASRRVVDRADRRKALPPAPLVDQEVALAYVASEPLTGEPVGRQCPRLGLNFVEGHAFGEGRACDGGFGFGQDTPTLRPLRSPGGELAQTFFRRPGDLRRELGLAQCLLGLHPLGLDLRRNRQFNFARQQGVERVDTGGDGGVRVGGDGGHHRLEDDGSIGGCTRHDRRTERGGARTSPPGSRPAPPRLPVATCWSIPISTKRPRIFKKAMRMAMRSRS
jgi:hypothetical protein